IPSFLFPSFMLTGMHQYRGPAPVRSDHAQEMLGLANGVGRIAKMISAPEQTGARGGGLASAIVGVALEARITRFMNDGDNAFAFHCFEIDPHQIVVRDRKSTRLNSSHSQISYAVFCLKKKKKKNKRITSYNVKYQTTK